MEDGNKGSKDFNKIYEALFPIIFRVAYRVVGTADIAEDVVHEAFIKYYERHEPLPDLDQTKYWLIRVVKNLSLNYAKKRTREKKAYERFKNNSFRHPETGEEITLKKEMTATVKEALDMLPENLRMVLVLKEYADLNYKEIGSILGISEGNVKVRVFRGREKLLKILKERI
jgi:RNA polymerase sigma factor (sigma-70 family)